MDEFVMTRSAQSKINSHENFVSVTYTAPKKKIKTSSDVVNSQTDRINCKNKFEKLESSKTDPNREHELEMKRLRWDVIKFGSSGFEGAAKRKAKVALALSLGAIPPKKRPKNYKKLLLERRKAKEIAAEKEKNSSGLSQSLKKSVKKKKPRKESGLSDAYGKVEKKRRK